MESSRVGDYILKTIQTGDGGREGRSNSSIILETEMFLKRMKDMILQLTDFKRIVNVT